jgi:hypothetical protein
MAKLVAIINTIAAAAHLDCDAFVGIGYAGTVIEVSSFIAIIPRRAGRK